MKAVIVIGLACVCCSPLSAQESFPVTATAGALQVSEGTPTVEVTLLFDGGLPVPIELVRLGRAPVNGAWHVAEVRPASLSGGRLAVRGPAGIDTLIVLRSAEHAGYIIHGPFRWPSLPATFVVATDWRRTLRGRLTNAGAAVAWVPAEQGSSSGSPVCLSTTVQWECIGVPLDARGVVINTEPGRIAFGIAAGPPAASGVETIGMSAAAWGRLITIGAAGQPEMGGGAVQAKARRLQVARARPQSLRADVVEDPAVRIASVDTRAFWVSAREAPADTWIELQMPGRAAARINVRELGSASAEIPFRVDLDPSAAIGGSVSAAGGVPARGTILALYRFEPAGPDKTKLKRIALAEAVADDEGSFRFDDLAAERYEVVAMHPVLGRAVRTVEAVPDGPRVEITLRRSPQLTGRVLRDGLPAAGVDVVIVPDLAQFASAEDITELRGGETQTDADGRFLVAQGARGSGELRIGDERTGVYRLALGPAESQPPSRDIGTIHLDATLETIVFEGSEGCELLVTGPIGRSGLTIVRPARLGPAMFQAKFPEPGRWQIVAVCAGRERAVVPGVVEIVPGKEATIRLTWRQ